MPPPRSGARRPRAPAARPVSGFDLLDHLIDTGVRNLVNVVGQKVAAGVDAIRAPEGEEPLHVCAHPHVDGICRAPTSRVCFACRRPSCEDHAEFWNDEGWAICGGCMHLMVDSVQRVLRAKARRARAVQPPPGPPPPPPGPTPWEVLGVPATADAQTIKRAYHKLCMQHHPDRNPNDPSSTTRFQEVTDAYHAMKAALEARA